MQEQPWSCLSMNCSHQGRSVCCTYLRITSLRTGSIARDGRRSWSSQPPTIAGNAKSYAERLFDFPQIGALDPKEAELAIVKPAREKGADYIPEATDEIVEQTRGYPYFLQEWGKHSWDIAKNKSNHA